MHVFTHVGSESGIARRPGARPFGEAAQTVVRDTGCPRQIALRSALRSRNAYFHSLTNRSPTLDILPWLFMRLSVLERF